MKKLALLLLVTAFCSCKRQNDITPTTNNNTSNTGKLTTRSGGDGLYDVLGYGIDVTRDLHDINSQSDAPIFDVARFKNDYPSRIDVNTQAAIDQKYYYGSNAVDFLNDVTNELAVGANVNQPSVEGASKTGKADPANDIHFFSASLNLHSTSENRAQYTTRYSYATFESWQRVKRIRFTGDAPVELLMQYLTPEFINNVNTMSADALVARYGTHIMLDISIGGVYRVDYTGSELTTATYDKKTSDFKIGLGVGAGAAIGVNLNYDKTNTQITQATQAVAEREFNVHIFGGNNSGMSVSIDNTGKVTENVSFASWQQSINANNAALIEIGKGLYLYDFITDPAKKAAVKASIEQHIAASQITLAPQEVYGFFTDLAGRHSYSLNPNMYQISPSDGWHPAGQPFNVYPVLYKNAIPVYHFFNTSTGDHVFGLTPTLGIPGYTPGDIMFYAYRNATPGTLPVYQFVEPSGKDHYYSTISTPFSSLWTRQGIAFYAFPATPTN